jgi:glutamyl-tRNA reductase
LQERLPDLLQQLTGQDGTIREAVVLSTCNRVEVYALCAGGVDNASDRVLDALSGLSGLDRQKARACFYTHEGPASASHLFEVTSGLDSMVVGETEILGQVKEAYQLAHAHHRTSIALNRLFQTAFSVAKQVRSQTRIGMGSVSVGSVAADLASQIFGELQDHTILMVGAGETGETTARALRSRGARSLRVTNRSWDKAEKLAAILEGTPVPWEKWEQGCADVDILISSTASPRPLIHRSTLEPHIKQRQGRPFFLIDIAVPRDIDRDVSQLEGVYLYDMDDLQVIAERNMAMRQKEIATCRQIIRDYVDQYETWFGSRIEQIAKCPTARQLEKWLKPPGLAPAS